MERYPQTSGPAGHRHSRPPYRVVDGFALPAVDVGRLRLRGDVGALCHVVRKGDSHTAWFAVECLGDLGDPAGADTLLWCLEVLRKDDLAYKAAALDPAYKPAVFGLDRPYISDYQRAAAWALGELGDSRAVKALFWATDQHFAQEAVAALGQIGGTDALSGLLDRLDALKWDPTYAAALGDLADPRATTALASILRDADLRPDVHRAAATALSRLDDSAVIEPLVEALANSDDQAALIAANALGQRRDAFPRLLEALGASDGPTRGGACFALGLLRDSSAAEPLSRILAGDPNPVVRRTAAKALGLLEEPGAMRTLLGYLTDADVGDAAAAALAALSDPPTTVLVALLKEGVPAQRQAAATALGQLSAFDCAANSSRL